MEQCETEGSLLFQVEIISCLDNPLPMMFKVFMLVTSEAMVALSSGQIFYSYYHVIKICIHKMLM